MFLVLLLLLTSTCDAYPSSYSGTVSSETPGGSFGKMGISNFESTQGTKCKITTNVPETGFIVGKEYKITLSTDVPSGLGMVWSVGGGSQANSGSSRLTSKEVKWTPKASDKTVSNSLICGAGGSYDKIWVAEKKVVKVGSGSGSSSTPTPANTSPSPISDSVKSMTSAVFIAIFVAIFSVLL